MLTFSTSQFEQFNAKAEERKLNSLSAEVLRALSEKAPQLVAKYSNDAIKSVVFEMVTAANSFGITDREQLIDWGYIRLATNVKFFEGAAFSFVLSHPYLHPFAKGRHIVLAYFNILKMEQERFFRWQ